MERGGEGLPEDDAENCKKLKLGARSHEGERTQIIWIRIAVDHYFHFCKIDGNEIQTEY
jgi:hypothetical protein